MAFPASLRDRTARWIGPFRPTLTHSGHSIAVNKERTDLIIARAQAIAALLSGLTLIWILVEFAAFETETALALAHGRLGAAAAFALIAVHRFRPLDLGAAHQALLALFLVPVVFFGYANTVFAGASATGGAALLSVHLFLPFVVAAGLGLFPLTASECLSLALPLLGGMTAAALVPNGPLRDAFDAGFLGLLALVAGIAAGAAMSQLRLLIRLTEQTTRDALTGALTRRFAIELLELMFPASLRAGTPLALLFIDLDRFKDVNDRFGHEAGDTVLRTAATSLLKAMRSQDLVIRWGGEEFLVVLPGSDAAGAVRAVQRLAAAGLGRRPDGRLQTASIGLAERLTDQAPSFAALLELADQRMYAAKASGRNRVAGPEGTPPSLIIEAT